MPVVARFVVAVSPRIVHRAPMKRLNGVILFLILALVILEIVTLRSLSTTQKRLSELERKVEALHPGPASPGR